ncbi:PAS domain S-box protein [candidate division KSB1 bacterium]|nr:PAS domain S-box protein [candidate division KSB1 bacterium]
MFYKDSMLQSMAQASLFNYYPLHSDSFTIKPGFQSSQPNPTPYSDTLTSLQERYSTYQPAIYAIDNRHQVIFWNEQIEKFTGIKQADIIGTSRHHESFSIANECQLVDVIIDNDLLMMRRLFPDMKSSKILSDGFQVNREYSNFNGKHIILQIHAAPLRDINGKNVGAYCILLNRTHHIQLEKSTTYRHLKFLVKNLPYTAIQTFTPDGRIKFWNSGSENIFKMSRKDVLGRRIQDLILANEELPLFESIIKEIVTQKQPIVPLEWKTRSINGQPRDFYAIMFPLVQQGECQEICCLSFDISSKKGLQADLNHLEIKYKELFDHSTELLALIDPTGNILSINHSFAHFLRLPLEKAESMNLTELLPGNELELLWQELEKINRGEENEPIEFIWQKPDGTEGVVELNMRLLSRNGNQQSILIMARDMTSRRELEHDLQESYRQIISTLVNFINANDIFTGKHSQRLVKHCSVMADLLGLSAGKKRDLQVASILHDVGKIQIPRSILRKFGILTAEERKILHKHAEFGANAVKRIPRFYRISKIIKYHHERYDGSGYPDGLKGNEIPIEARILAVVDAFDAMISDRPYRKSLGIGTAFYELRAGRGTQFDPQVVDVFIEFSKRKYHVDDQGLPDYISSMT